MRALRPGGGTAATTAGRLQLGRLRLQYTVPRKTRAYDIVPIRYRLSWEAGANGKVAMYRPQGAIGDPKAKIAPFKYHTGRLPIETATGLMVPVQVGPTFRTGNTMASAIGGAKGFRGKELTAQDISYVEVERWMLSTTD